MPIRDSGVLCYCLVVSKVIDDIFCYNCDIISSDFAEFNDHCIVNHSEEIITKTWLYNFDPLKPHFYIVKLGFTGVYIIFLISAQNMDCGYSLEPPRRGGSNEYPQSMFCAEM